MSWVPDLSAASGPIYRAIADRLRDDVEAGRVRPGEKLLPQRELARRLGIDLTTVTRAFAEATKQGLIVSEGRRGTFVRERRGAAAEGKAAADEASSGMNMPPEPEGGMLRQRLQEGFAGLLQSRTPPLHYQPAGRTEAESAAAPAVQ